MSSYHVLILHYAGRASVLSLQDYLHVSATGLRNISVFFNGEAERKEWTVLGPDVLVGYL